MNTTARAYGATKRDRFDGLTIIAGPAPIIAAAVQAGELEALTRASAARIYAAARQHRPDQRPRPLKMRDGLYALYLDLPAVNTRIPAQPYYVRTNNPQPRRIAA
jgi:hypothetical protein